MPAKTDLTGQRFGYLTVTGCTEPDKKGRRKWLCRCDCGREIAVFPGNLKRNPNVSCGCKRQRDLTGQRFGRLMVVEYSQEYTTRGSRRQRLWKCLCDCGETVYRPTDTLTNTDESMCRTCAGKYTAENARASSGYRDGTQTSRIRNINSESDNLSKIRGVYLDTKTGKYRARIKFQGKIRNLGTFTTLDAAIKARKNAEEEIFGTFLERGEGVPSGGG